ncbi:hypothetical protein ABBQ32_006065 [Trebouxia sp. C0010 RCD-2024]
MISSQAAAQGEGAAASQASSSTGKSSADVEKHCSLLLKRRETALKPSTKSKGAAWWDFFEVKILRDPVTNAATNVLLKCTLCEQQLSSNNPTRLAETHLVKGGCLKIKTSAATVATISDRLIKQPAEPVQHQGEVNALEKLMSKKRRSETPSVAHASMKKEQQVKAREALGDFFLRPQM